MPRRALQIREVAAALGVSPARARRMVERARRARRARRAGAAGDAATGPPLRRLLTVEEAADALAVSRPTVYRLMRAGLLAYVEIGRVRRVALADLDAMLGRLSALPPLDPGRRLDTGPAHGGDAEHDVVADLDARRRRRVR